MCYFYYISLLALLFSCNHAKPTGEKTAETVEATPRKDEVKYVNSIEISSPEKNRVFNYNEPIEIAFNGKDKFPVDSAQVFINGEKVATTGKDVFSFKCLLPGKKTGNTTLKVIAFHPENKRGIASESIIVKPDKAPQKYTYGTVKVYPHDPQAYTQGLIYQDGFMYEGTGQYGESGIRKIDLKNGNILSTLNIDNKLFGEGITIYKDKIYQLTWTSRKGFVYDLKSFTLESTFNYNTQGWGLTTMGDRLIMSDGTNKLFHIEPSAFGVIKEVEVYDNNGAVQQLNELEYIDGLVWANVWMSDRIVMIDPETGEVKGELDMSQLLPASDRNKLDDSDDVLNGIAWNKEKGTVYLTGKRWPKLFEIKVQY